MFSGRLSHQLRPAFSRGDALGRLSCSGNCRFYHVAIVGSGPAAFYTAKYIDKLSAKALGASVSVDMFERLPTPFGLVRFGVAPDHPEVKNVITDFTEVAGAPSFRFFGNVEIGKHLSVDTLRQAYDAVVMATGAEGERRLGIPGEDLHGVVGAPAFVKWYNGHPDYREMEAGEPGTTAVVIGQGNVALDVARLLLRGESEVQSTDMDAGAIQRIAKWHSQGLKEVQVVGRRGFIQAAFTNAELRELLTISDDILPVVDPAELALCRNPSSEEELSKSRMKKRSVDILQKMADNFALRDTTAKRVLWLRFLMSPVEVLPNSDGSQVGGIRLERTQLQGEPGQQRAVRAASAATEDVTCGLVVRSVGFDLEPINGLPLDSYKRVSHQQGRVAVSDANVELGSNLYVSGWVKRGPSGIIASNIPDAQETAVSVLKDLKERTGGVCANPTVAEAALAESDTRVVTFGDWQKLEAEEQRRGAASGQSAQKITNVGEMIRFLDGAA